MNAMVDYWEGHGARLFFGGRQNLDSNTLYFLTGKKLDLTKRKKIIIDRIGGHLYIYDTEFIINQKYKNALNKKVYECVHIDSKGVALLKPQGKRLKAIATDVTTNWQVI